MQVLLRKQIETNTRDPLILVIPNSGIEKIGQIFGAADVDALIRERKRPTSRSQDGDDDDADN
jgi:hypothetical protein